ncbi:MAG: hypothetical protein F6J95_014780 [Leptolyngbya sp. SIO1E4]|nr:hypothetical protein [Leptolyngbya sp. SIO1E4]
MSAVLKSEAVTSHPQASIPARARKSRRLTVLPSKNQTVSTLPIRLPTRRPYPLWLKLLGVCQRASCGMAVVAIAGTLVTYALTVNTNRKLTLATANLEHLQTQQQQLTAANAVFKNHLSQTAMTTLQSNGLHPKDVIFLETAKTPAAVPEEKAAPPAPSQPKERVFPKGY